MKTMTTISAGLCLAFAAGAACAQELIVEQTTITDPTLTVGSTTPTPEAPAIARKEAGAALAQARQECRKASTHEAQQSCLADARADHDRMMSAARPSMAHTDRASSPRAD